jgi:hypothetical protein
MKRMAQRVSFRAAWRMAKTNRSKDFVSVLGWWLGLRRVRLTAVLDQVAAATGLVIEVKPKVDPHCRIQWDQQPVTPENALARLTQALNSKRYLAIQKGRKVTIIRAQDAMKLTVPLPVLRPAPVPTRTALLARILSTDVIELVRMLAYGSGAFGPPRTSA